MEEKLGMKVGKGKVSPEVLKTYQEMVAPKVLQTVVRGIMKGVFSLDEEMTGKPVEGELVETVSSGSPNCAFRYHFQPTPYSSKPGK